MSSGKKESRNVTSWVGKVSNVGWGCLSVEGTTELAHE